ncbi:MAG: hypothetical protein HWD59_02885 [Coxiellaceae bacterium]|nr:MAG: hypothetical protein HWD59_02885 [Coxiellaceae bacterium]
MCSCTLTLYANATAIIIASFNTEEYKQIKQQRPTVISVMGKSNHDIVHDVALSADDFASVKFNFSGVKKLLNN